MSHLGWEDTDEETRNRPYLAWGSRSRRLRPGIARHPGERGCRRHASHDRKRVGLQRYVDGRDAGSPDQPRWPGDALPVPLGVWMWIDATRSLSAVLH